MKTQTSTKFSALTTDLVLRTGSAMRAVCAIAILLAASAIGTAATCPPLPAGAIYPPSGTMVAWYSFDETASPSVNLATQNKATWSGEVAGAVDFSNGYMDAPDSIVSNFGPAGNATCPNGGDYSTCQGDFSFDVWLKLDVLPNGNVNAIVDKRNGSEIGYSFYIYGSSSYFSGYPWIGVQLGDQAHSYTNYGSPALEPPLGNQGNGLTVGTWHHVAVTVSRKSPGILWYFDGTLIPGSPTQIPTQTGTLLNNVPLSIGANGAANSGGSNFLGSLDELQIFNRVLTAKEVESIYNARTHGQCKP
jgi:hypothetical protein